MQINSKMVKADHSALSEDSVFWMCPTDNPVLQAYRDIIENAPIPIIENLLKSLLSLSLYTKLRNKNSTSLQTKHPSYLV